EGLLRAHLNALVAEVASLNLLQDNAHYFEPLGKDTDPLVPSQSMREEFLQRLEASSGPLDQAICGLFLDDPTLECGALSETLTHWKDGFWPYFESHLNALGEEYAAVKSEIAAMNE